MSKYMLPVLNNIQKTKIYSHPCSEAQNELGSLNIAYEPRDSLCNHKDKLLKLLIVHHIFLLG